MKSLKLALRQSKRGWPWILLLAGMLGFRLGWGWWVDRQLAAKQTEIRKLGQPSEWKEISYPAVNAEENAWPVWVKAINSISTTVWPPRSTNVDYGEPPYPPGWFPVAAASEKANAMAIALARTARNRPAVQFRTRLPAPESTWLSYLNPAHSLVNVLADAAEYSHFTGDEDEAIERLIDLVALGDALHQDDFFVSQLVAIGTLNQACNSIQLIAPGITAKEKSIRRLIDALLDERRAREGVQRSIQIERLMRPESYRARAEGTWWIRPVAHREMIRAMDGFEVMDEAARCTNFEDAREVLKRNSYAPSPRTVTGKPAMPRYSRWFVEPGIDPDSILQRMYRERGVRRLAATALACALYHTQRGKWPAKLDDLVPEYLPAVPKHPFRADGRPIESVVLKGVGAHSGDLTIFSSGAESAKAIDGQPDQADAPGPKSKVKDKNEKP